MAAGGNVTEMGTRAVRRIVTVSVSLFEVTLTSSRLTSLVREGQNAVMNVVRSDFRAWSTRGGTDRGTREFDGVCVPVPRPAGNRPLPDPEISPASP